MPERFDKKAKAKPSLGVLKRELASLADKNRAQLLSRYFKTGKGQYGEGDRFLGLSVPTQRKVALRYRELPLEEIKKLLHSPIHEHRFTGLEILVAQYERGSEEECEEIFQFYLSHTQGINNWDLVDTSAPYIVGNHLQAKSRSILKTLAVSPNLWERRIAILATFAFLRKGETADTLGVAAKLLSDPHDLIHKAVGWALREVGKVDKSVLVDFLKTHYDSLPRTALRYAIERFPAADRKRWLAGNLQLS